MEINYKPFFGQILCEQPKVEVKTKKGIYLTQEQINKQKKSTEDVHESAKFYKVLLMAADVNLMLEKRAKDAGLELTDFPQVGDLICTWGQGMILRIDDVEYITCSINDVIGKRIYNPEPVEEEIEDRKIII